MTIQNELKTKEYLRQRYDPQPGDPFYLILSDLKNAIQEVVKNHVKKKSEPERILDFGCGGSPYRKFFDQKSYYKKADVGNDSSIDFQMDLYSSTIKSPDNQFDVILSTQVLEHVESPSSYLSEAFRVLQPEGLLILSTHGTYQDHPCPKDYWRWTGAGLSQQLEKAGFKTLRTLYCTTGPRAALAILEMNIPRLGQGRFWTKMVYELIAKIWITLRLDILIHRFIDRLGQHYRIAEDLPPYSGIYVTLLMVATPIKK